MHVIFSPPHCIDSTRNQHEAGDLNNTVNDVVEITIVPNVKSMGTLLSYPTR